MIEFEGVSKSFRHGAGARLLRGHVQEWLRGVGGGRFFALRGVSFRLEAGESMAVVGRNGAGKSTLLSLVAGLARPDCGRVSVEGRVAALLELGSGFHPDLTGLENLRLNASLLGLSRRRICQRAQPQRQKCAGPSTHAYRPRATTRLSNPPCDSTLE